MSVKISYLKKSKQIVSEWLNINYEGEYSIFYSIGTKDKQFNDQFLKIELDGDIKRFPYYAAKIREELLSNNSIYSELRFKIFDINR